MVSNQTATLESNNAFRITTGKLRNEENKNNSQLKYRQRR